MVNVPFTFAITPVEVKESMDKLVGSTTIASIAYSCTTCGRTKATTMMTAAAKQSRDRATKLGHLAFDFFVLGC